LVLPGSILWIRSTNMSPDRRAGPHELGQNFLTDRRIIQTVIAIVADTEGPIVEWAAGAGALTVPLSKLSRSLLAVEIDPHRVATVRRRVGPHVCIVEGDILRHAPPPAGAVLVSNVPFHITTAVLRRLLGQRTWHTAVLITQWEVARKRAGVGGATQLTAQWWPWYEFSLRQRIPSGSFTPRPSVDGGLLVIERRTRPLVTGNPTRYQQWVRAVFTGPGNGIAEVLARSGGIARRDAHAFCHRAGLSTESVPKHLTARQWADAYRLRQ